ncbi:MAG: hypothetical protein JWQ22_1981 [Devosia sp.]|nr:hypothetical protein [Devosia sp.]
MAYWFLSADVSMDAVMELSTETPRAAAVVGAAITDSVLTETLLKHFPREGRTRDDLFNSSGGRLGDYDTKAKLAYALGIISTQAFQDIGTIGQIRNKFAHRLEINSFSHPTIVKLCMHLKLIETTVGSLTRTSDPGVRVRFMEPDLDKKLADPRAASYCQSKSSQARSSTALR